MEGIKFIERIEVETREWEVENIVKSINCRG